MSSQASASTSTDLDTQIANSPATSGTPTHDESDQDLSTGPPRKRSRKSKSKPKRMHGFLAGIVHVPMDIFAQITSHLHPIDIHSLARTSKKFRKLLMSRSSKHIWRAAERNVLGLPPCPEHITEPEYAALVFGKWCSMCGSTGNVSRRMDEILAVRLCSNCREKQIVGMSFVAQSALPFVRLSRVIKQPTTISPAYGLMNEVNWVVSLVFDLAARGEIATLEKWKQERIAQLKKQAEFVRALVPFLDALDDQRDDEIEELKAQRFAAIKAKLMECGWEEVDCHVTHLPLLREWEKLVAQPKLLTNRTWENIKPKLEPILRANRQARLIRERNQRREDRKTRLCQLVADIGVAGRRVIELAPEHEQPSGPETIVIPFPNHKQALKLQAVRDILKEDVSGDVAEEKFMAVRERVLSQLDVWRRSVAEKLCNKLMAGSSYSSILAPSAWRARRSPLPPVVISTQFTDQSQPHIQGHDIRKILRADSVFQIGTDQTCWFFPDVVEMTQAILPVQEHNYGSPFDSDGEDEDSKTEYYNWRYELPPVLDLSRVYRHSAARRAAECLLACLGKSDAAYLEMKALGRRFVCGRCWVKTPMTWAEILEHYSQLVVYNWPYPTVHSFQQKGIERKEEHVLFKEPEFLGSKSPAENSSGDTPGEDDAKERRDTRPAPPLVRLVTLEEAEAAENDSLSPKFLCGVCDAVSVLHNGQGVDNRPIPRPMGSKEVILEHLDNVHNISEEERESMLVEIAQS